MTVSRGRTEAAPTSFADFVSAGRNVLGARAENWVFLRRPDSTHRVARQLVKELASEDETPQPTGFLALEQTAGQGRRGRAWASPPGGLYLTFVAPAVEEAAVRELPIRAAVEMAGAVRSMLPSRPCTVKWPNDLMVDGAKIGGLLLESRRGDEGVLVLVSCGLNVAVTPEVDRRAVTSIREEGGSATWAQALAAVVSRLESVLSGERRAGAGTWIDEYRKISAHRLDEPLACRVGDESVEGVFAGFDEQGFLRLRTRAGERLLSAAEVIE